MKTSIKARDGFSISMSFYEPDEKPVASILLSPAMGVAQDFYAPFANWLKSEGYRVASFDYRGMGQSKHGSLSELNADVLDWARLDASAAFQALLERAGDAPVYWLGHSLGGQIVPLVDSRERIQKIITVATGSGYWLQNAWQLRWKVWFLWFFVVPLSIPICGYFPGKKLKMVGDLPANVMWQWRRWCLNRNYLLGVEGDWVRNAFEAVKTPIISISFTDDELMSAANIQSIHAFYKNAPRKMLRISPSDVGLKQIGHFGFFREKMKEILWKAVVLKELKND